jgi:molybdopterin converting factor small subunit
MSAVRIPPVLRAAAGGRKQVEVGGATVGAVIGDLVATYPGLRDQLLTPDGLLNRFVNVYLNDEDIRYLAELETPASERDTIVILPAMAGGAA